MNKKISLGAAVAFMLVIAGITFCITMMVSLNYFNEKVLNVNAREEMYKKLADVDRNARQNFVGKIDEELLENSISAGYVRGLGDKYASYLTKDEYERRLLEDSGKLVSVGMTIAKDSSGYFKVTKVATDTVAEQAGVQVDDLIVSIDTNDLKSISQVNAEQMLKGEIGTKVSIVYRRDGVDTTKDLQRKDIIVEYVSAHLIESTGYIQISSFNDKTLSQFNVAVNSVIQQGAAALVIDLRNNNSDSFDAAASILNTLLPSGALGTKTNNQGQNISLGNSDQYAINLPMATIINAKTGNAAEYFAATLRDVVKANTIGVTSFGKSIEQEMFQLNDGSAINITVSYVYPPSKADINGVGIKPDYEVKLSPEQEQTFDMLTDQTDPQIQKALEVVNSKK